jgi:mycothiol synthase
MTQPNLEADKGGRTGLSSEAGLRLRPHDPHDDEWVVRLWRRLDPEYPPLAVEEYRALVKSLPSQAVHERFVVEHAGEIVGHGSLLQKFWVEQQGSFAGEIGVEPGFWRRGVGTALYDRMVQAASELRAVRLYGAVRDDRPDSLHFAEKRGFVPTGHVTRMSRLDVREVDLEGYEGLDERLRADNIDVTTLARLGPEDDGVLRRLHQVSMSTAQDEPGSEAFSMPFEQWRDTFLTQPGISPDSTWVATHGTEFIGTTTLRRQGGNSAWNQGMGVERAYRGRGVARLMKQRTVEWARDNGVDFLYTGNDVDNPRMYAINVRLGYRPLPSRTELVKEMPPQPDKEAATEGLSGQ